MDSERMKAISEGANMSTGGVNWNYVDTAKLERQGIGRYATKKPKGNNFIRIVAPDTTGPFAKEIHVHTQIGSSKVTYLCLDKMYGEPCPVCEHIQELRRQNVSNDTIKDLGAGRRFLLFVVDTTSRESEEEGPKWFDCPPSIYKNVCTLSQDRRTGEKIDPTDPVDGRDIEFIRVDGKMTKYEGFVLTKTEPIPKSWYDGLPTFDDVLLKPNPDEMRVAVSGVKSAPTKADEDNRGSSRRESTESRREEPAQESRRESRREESAQDAGDSEQAAAIKGKIDDIQSRRRARE